VDPKWFVSTVTRKRRVVVKVCDSEVLVHFEQGIMSAESYFSFSPWL